MSRTLNIVIASVSTAFSSEVVYFKNSMRKNTLISNLFCHLLWKVKTTPMLQPTNCMMNVHFIKYFHAQIFFVCSTAMWSSNISQLCCNFSFLSPSKNACKYQSASTKYFIFRTTIGVMSGHGYALRHFITKEYGKPAMNSQQYFRKDKQNYKKHHD